MAYTLRQKQIAAYAVALSGFNAAAAATWLRERSVEAGDIGESTLRRWLAEAEFQALVESQAQIVREELNEATRQAERARLKRDLSETFAGRLQDMETAWWDLLERLKAEVANPETDKRELLTFWSRLGEQLLRFKQQRAPAIAELWQAEALIGSYQRVLLRVAGPALTEKIQREVGQDFQRALLARANDTAREPQTNADERGCGTSAPAAVAPASSPAAVAVQASSLKPQATVVVAVPETRNPKPETR